MTPQLLKLIVNGRTHYAALAPNTTLLYALRDLGYTDVKSGCEKGDCGACGVLVDGTPVLDIKPVMVEFLPREPVHQPEWSHELMKEYWNPTKKND